MNEQYAGSVSCDWCRRGATHRLEKPIAKGYEYVCDQHWSAAAVGGFRPVPLPVQDDALQIMREAQR